MKKYIFPFLALALTACVEDEGNYTYRTLNEITIEDDTETIEALSYIDEIEISPKVTGSIDGDDLGNYEFKWHLCYNSHTHVTIGNEKDLKWVCDVPPGSYTIYLTITDKVTSLEKSYYRNLLLSSPFTQGFLILGEDLTTGKGGLDMLTMAANRDTVMVENVYEDIDMLTAPEKLLYTGRAPYPSAAAFQNLWVSANGNDFRLSSGSTFEYECDFSNAGILEIPTIPHKDPIRLVDVFPHQGAYSALRSNSTFRGYLTEEHMFGGAVYTGDYHTQPINQYVANSTKFFKPAPYVWYTYAYTRPTVFIAYDMDSNIFVKLPTAYQYTCTPLTDTGAEPWRWNAGSEGRTLVYGENDPTGAYGMSNAVMKDADNNYFIYRFQVPTSAYGVIAKQPLYTIDQTKAVDFDKAEHIMFSGIKTAMLYSVGNRVYQYDYARNMCGYLDFDDPVTYLAGEFASYGSKDEFFVATYGDQTKGKIYKYEVGSDPNEIAFNLREGEVWNTRLKVKDIEWKYGD